MKAIILFLVSMFVLLGCETKGCEGLTAYEDPSKSKRSTVAKYYAKIKIETTSGTPCDEAQVDLGLSDGYRFADSLGIIRAEFEIKSSTHADSIELDVMVYKYPPDFENCPLSECVITFQCEIYDIVDLDSFWEEITPHIVIFPNNP